MMPVTASPSTNASIAKMPYAEPGLCPRYIFPFLVSTPRMYSATAAGPNINEPKRAYREPTTPQMMRSTTATPIVRPSMA